MTDTPKLFSENRDLRLLQLAREVAIDHLDTETILKLYSLTTEQWESIKADLRFQELLKSEVVAWQTATNTSERTRLKAGALLEHWLPEANKRIFDSAENLNSKVELAKLLSRLAGFEAKDGAPQGGGFSVTINLGSDQLTFAKQPKMIDITPDVL